MSAWQRFARQKTGYYSLIVLLLLFVLSLCAELLSNDKPLLAHYNGRTFSPLLQDLPETALGGDFVTPADYLDPFVQQQLAKPGNWAIFPPNRYHYSSINAFAQSPNPAPPSRQNWLGTDEQGRDVVARLLYGFRISMLFGLAVAAIVAVLGATLGAIQGYFGGWVDLIGQRLEDIWGSMPTLYLLIILAAIFSQSIWLLILLLSIFGWLGISAYMRAEYLRNRNLDYVRAAQALGVPHGRIMRKHILPNALVPLITLLPFEMTAAILSLTSLDFLGLGLPPTQPSLGELLNQGKANLDAWWITVPTFATLVVLLLLLTLVGDALRNTFDTRKTLA